MARWLATMAMVCGFPVAMPAAETIRIACVGDSITEGAGLMNREKEAYPAVLQQLLGETYDVKNFGVSGRTLLSKGDAPYINEKKYKDALAFLPNIVVIKLGTNDTKPANWKHAEEFVADYTALIESFAKLESKPKIYLCTPVPAFPGEWGIENSRIKDGVIPKVLAIAKDKKRPVIDLYQALSGKAKLFPDKVHPNAAGAKLMAQAVQKALQPTE